MLKNLERKSAMSDPDNVKTATESVGLVKDAASLQAAIDELILSEFRKR